MAPQLRSLVSVERPGFVQDPLLDRELADVVHRTADR
jgi:hypothetical protein